MSRIHIERPHSLGLDAARAKAEKLAERLAKEHGVQCEWQGDELTFKRSGVDGRIAVGGGQGRGGRQARPDAVGHERPAQGRDREGAGQGAGLIRRAFAVLAAPIFRLVCGF